MLLQDIMWVIGFETIGNNKCLTLFVQAFLDLCDPVERLLP